MKDQNDMEIYSLDQGRIAFAINCKGRIVKALCSTIEHHVRAFERVCDIDYTLSVRLGEEVAPSNDCIEVNGVTISPGMVAETAREYKGAKWKYIISGLDDKCLKCSIKANPLGYRYMAGTVLDLCLLLNSVKLGLPLIHASAIQYNEKGVLICGRGGAGKTTIALRIARQGNARIVSDNYLFLDEMRVISYPAPLNLFAYNIDAELRKSIGRHMRCELKVKEIIHRLSMGKIKLFITPPIEDILPGRTKRDMKVDRIIFIAQTNGPLDRVELSRHEAMEFITWNQILENELYEHIFAAHAYAFSKGVLARFWHEYRSMIENRLLRVEKFVLFKIPNGMITDDVIAMIRNEIDE